MIPIILFGLSTKTISYGIASSCYFFRYFVRVNDNNFDSFWIIMLLPSIGMDLSRISLLMNLK